MSFAALRADDRILISGATGWLGREILSRLLMSRPDVPILAFARKKRTFVAGEHTLLARPWNHEFALQWEPTLFIHLAYLTREWEGILGTGKYESENRSLSTKALKIMAIPSLRGSVIASSGAAIKFPQSTYGRLKLQDEHHFAMAGEIWKVPTVIARAWSISGEFCPKPNHFALYDLIYQTLNAPQVCVRAPHATWRRYVDAGEYLEVCLGLAALGHSQIVDSDGPLVEIGELAHQIQETLGVQRPIVRPPRSGMDDRYFSDSKQMTHWAQRLTVSISDLQTQIHRSAAAVENVKTHTERSHDSI